jgi:hypothetical protein
MVIIPESDFEALLLTTQLIVERNEAIRNIIRIDCEFKHYKSEINQPILRLTGESISVAMLFHGDV